MVNFNRNFLEEQVAEEEQDPKERLVSLVSTSLTSTKRTMDELRNQIESTRSSVDKERQRYSTIATEVRNIKENLDTVPREDIRDKYEEALEVRFRMATMQGQLERTEAVYTKLEEYQGLLSEVMNAIQGYDDFMLADGEEVKGPSRNVDVIGIIRAQEEERQRLARQMHDGPAQSLTNYILQAEIVQRLFDRNPDRAAEELENLKGNASRTFQKVRDFIFDLRPMMLTDLGVAPTVRRYVETFADKNDIECKLDIKNEERRMENYLEVMIFRGVQDLMGLARDYASPGTIEIQLDMMQTDNIRITVEDDGDGFDSSLLDGDTENFKDPRLQAMAMLRARFELLGGIVDARSNENEGSIIRIDLPTGE